MTASDLRLFPDLEVVIDLDAEVSPDSVQLTLQPALAATARFGPQTPARRTEPLRPAMVRKLMTRLLRDSAVAVDRASHKRP